MAFWDRFKKIEITPHNKEKENRTVITRTSNHLDPDETADSKENFLIVPKVKVDIFIGYQMEDSDYVKRLSLWLEQKGFRTWYYERDIPIGKPSIKSIEEAIDSAYIVLVILSPSSIQSDGLFNEIHRSFKNTKVIIPILNGINFDDLKTQKYNWINLLGGRRCYLSTDCDLIYKQISDCFQSFKQDSKEVGTEKKTNTTFFQHAQFTIFRPITIVPEKWYDFLFFAHPASRIDDGDDDPLKEIARQAKEILQEAMDNYGQLGQDSSITIPREGMISIRPSGEGIVFNTPERIFFWYEPIHREIFRIKADQKYLNQVVRGNVSVFYGVICIAEIKFSLQISGSESLVSPSFKPNSAKIYRKIFPSYSRKDNYILDQVIDFAAGTGDRYLKDLIAIKPGTLWREEIRKSILEADIFQLFWSNNSMVSPEVRQEWEFALSLNRPNFVIPVYWEDPFPQQPEIGLPPDQLKAINFYKLNYIKINANEQTKNFQVINKVDQKILNYNEILENRYHEISNQVIINDLKDNCDLNEILILLKEQKEICRKLGNLELLQECLGNQAIVLFALGEFNEAMALFKQQERICRALGDLKLLQGSLTDQLVLIRAHGDRHRTAELLSEIIEICRKLGNLELLQECLGEQAVILRVSGDFSRASELLWEKIEICRKLGNDKLLQECLGEQAEILMVIGKRQRAMALYEEQERICRELRNIEDIQF